MANQYHRPRILAIPKELFARCLYHKGKWIGAFLSLLDKERKRKEMVLDFRAVL